MHRSLKCENEANINVNDVTTSGLTLKLQMENTHLKAKCF